MDPYSMPVLVQAFTMQGCNDGDFSDREECSYSSNALHTIAFAQGTDKLVAVD